MRAAGAHRHRRPGLLRRHGPPLVRRGRVDRGRRREATAAFQRLLDGEVAVPVVGAANATAVAGGLELLLGCDVVVASSEAQLGLPEVKRGLFAAGGGTALGPPRPAGRRPRAGPHRRHHHRRPGPRARPGQRRRPAGRGARHRRRPRRAHRRERPARPGRLQGAGPPLGHRPARAAERLAHWQGVVFSSEDAREGATAFVERREPGVAGPLTACGPPSARRSGPPRSSRSPSVAVAAARAGPGPHRRRPPARSTSPTCCSSPASTSSRCRPRSSPAARWPAWSPRWPTTSTDVAVGDRVTGTALVGAFAEEAVVGAAAVTARARRRSTLARPPPPAWRTAPPTTCCARWPGVPAGEEVVVLGAGGGVGLAAVQLAAALGASVTAVASSEREAGRRRRLRGHHAGRPAAATSGRR